MTLHKMSFRISNLMNANNNIWIENSQSLTDDFRTLMHSIRWHSTKYNKCHNFTLILQQVLLLPAKSNSSQAFTLRECQGFLWKGKLWRKKCSKIFVCRLKWGDILLKLKRLFERCMNKNKFMELQRKKSAAQCNAICDAIEKSIFSTMIEYCYQMIISAIPTVCDIDCRHTNKAISKSKLCHLKSDFNGEKKCSTNKVVDCKKWRAKKNANGMFTI